MSGDYGSAPIYMAGTSVVTTDVIISDGVVEAGTEAIVLQYDGGWYCIQVGTEVIRRVRPDQIAVNRPAN